MSEWPMEVRVAFIVAGAAGAFVDALRAWIVAGSTGARPARSGSPIRFVPSPRSLPRGAEDHSSRHASCRNVDVT